MTTSMRREVCCLILDVQRYDWPESLLSMGQLTILSSRDALGTPHGWNGLGNLCERT
jgi:hypothetical protein